MPPLVPKFGAHYRVTCSDCRADAEVCCKRLDGDGAERRAVALLLKSGWHADGLGLGNIDPLKARWICSKCGPKANRG